MPRGARGRSGAPGCVRPCRFRRSELALSRRIRKNGDRRMKRAENIMIRPRPMMPRSDQISGPDAVCTDLVNIHVRREALTI